MLVAADPLLPVLLGRPLEPLGHSLTVVDSAAELRRRLPEVEPPAVLLPRRLPDAPLRDAVAWLRRSSTTSPSPPSSSGSSPATARWPARPTPTASCCCRSPIARCSRCWAQPPGPQAGAARRRHAAHPPAHRADPHEAGYEVLSALDGAEALAMGSQRRPTWWSPTSRCRRSTATGCAPPSRTTPSSPTCRCSSARRWARPPTSSAASTSAPTTTWSSRSSRRS